MKLKLFALTLCILLVHSSLKTYAYDSDLMLKGRILNEQNQPVMFATAVLINSTSQAFIKGEISDDKGEFTIQNLQPGKYYIQVRMLGYRPYQSELIEIKPGSGSHVKTIILDEAIETLSKVEIIAKRDFIELTPDKMVVYPEASPSTANENVYEILQKLPGVNIDNNNNISLKGLQGVKITIDDKPGYLSPDQLAAVLKNMQGKNVDKIEIIDNPSARYDAEGNAGIINIKTRHNKTTGFNGSVNAGLSVGDKLNENTGINLNMNFGKVNLYGNYSFYNWGGDHELDGKRIFEAPEIAGSSQDIDMLSHNSSLGHNYKVGTDYFFNKRHVFSMMFWGNDGLYKSNSHTSTIFNDKNQVCESKLITESESENRWNNRTFNANYMWDIDSSGQNLMIDFDYAYFKVTNNSEQNTTFFNGNGIILDDNFGVNTDQGGQIDVFSAKADYVYPINAVYTIEGGVKASTVTNDNKITMYGRIEQEDKYIFKENIQALYLSAQAKYAKTSLQLGIRVENTQTEGNSVNMNRIDESSYLNVFPSMFVQRQLDKNQNLNLRYSYRIGRPQYSRLNPFKWMLDPYTFMEGNPYLKPQFTHMSSISHSYKGMFVTTAGINYTTDLFADVLLMDEKTKIMIQTLGNYNQVLDLNLSEYFQLDPLKWLNIRGTFTIMYKSVTSDFIENEEFDKLSFSGNLNCNVLLPQKINMEISGHYTSEEIYGNFLFEPNYRVNFGIQKKVFNDKGNLKLAISDVFYTGLNKASAHYNNLSLRAVNRFDSRKISLSFTYRFGKDNFKTRGNRSTSSSEEQSRSGK